MERDIVALFIAEWGAHPRMRLWRQQVGAVKIKDEFKFGKPKRKGRFVRFGVKGMADYGGIIMPLNSQLGLCLQIEFKADDESTDPERRKNQARWREMIEERGGIYLRVKGQAGLAAARRRLIPLIGRPDSGEQ